MSTLYPGTKIGTIIDRAVWRYNSIRSGADGTIPEVEALALINECLQDDLSLEDYWCETALLDITAGEPYIDLLTDIPTIKRMLNLSYAASSSESASPHLLKHIQNYGQLESLRQSLSASYATDAYCYFGYKIWWVNTPAATRADALKILYSYTFPAVTGQEVDNIVSDVPEHFPNKLFVAYIMKEMLLRDHRKAKAGDVYSIWADEYRKLKREVLGEEGSGSGSMRPTRGYD